MRERERDTMVGGGGEEVGAEKKVKEARFLSPGNASFRGVLYCPICLTLVICSKVVIFRLLGALEGSAQLVQILRLHS